MAIQWLLSLSLLFLSLVCRADEDPNRIPSLKEVAVNYDIAKMNTVLDHMKTYDVLPVFNNIPTDQYTPGDYQLDPEIVHYFHDAQIKVFGKELIALKPCTNGCMLTAEYALSTIFYDREEIEEILNLKSLKEPKKVIEFLLTHELSHFVQEITCHPPFSQKDFVCGGGYRSAYAPIPEAYTEVPTILGAVRIHTEVDVYATLVARQMGLTAFEDLYTYYEYQIGKFKTEPDKLTRDYGTLDLASREQSIKAVLKKLK